MPATTDKKICETCLKKHNFSATKILPPHPYQPFRRPSETSSLPSTPDFECNLCKKILPTEPKLREHLVEHTFAGCENRGFNCYICSSVFTGPTGLLGHMQDEHGENSKPYDCSRCTLKFFFRAELEHHSFMHEPILKEIPDKILAHEPEISMKEGSLSPKIKEEINQDNEEEEYIEVEEPKSETIKKEIPVVTNEDDHAEQTVENNTKNKDEI